MNKKRRTDSFFGLHFDFHADPAGPSACVIGGRTTDQSLMDLLRVVQPDFVQCDCKGHPGWSSYPSQAGFAYPDIAGDPLRTWRSATERMGVALYVHYSGVVDAQACYQHPDWARISPERAADTRVTSTFGPYVDELLIPQLLELAGEYGVDGIWVDGECWGTQADYSHRALERYREATGTDLIFHPPVKRCDPHYEEYRDFCREQFRRYLRHYVDAVHSRYPDFQIASNWAFSSQMPEAVSANVDFLSGDFSPQNSVNAARFEGRCLASQGLSWDLMAWGFTISEWHGGDGVSKCETQLKQEAAVVLAMGGGFQVYNKQRLDGSISGGHISVLAGVGRFVRERRRWCHKARFVPQIALLYSMKDHYCTSEYLFMNDKTDSVQGMTQLLCDTQQSFEILSEHNLMGKLDRWPLIVLPNTCFMEDEFRQELLEYTGEGGKLLVIGPSAVDLFASELGIRPIPCDGNRYLSADGAVWASCHGPVSEWAVCGDAVKIGYFGTETDGDGFQTSAAGIYPYGKGKIACLPADIGLSYKTCKAPAVRALMHALTDNLYEPMVTVKGSSHVDVTVLERDGQLLIQLINTAGPHDSPNWRSIDEIPAVGPLAITVRLDKPPRNARFMPSDQDAQGIWEDGTYGVTLNRLEIHEILAVDR